MFVYFKIFVLFIGFSSLATIMMLFKHIQNDYVKFLVPLSSSSSWWSSSSSSSLSFSSSINFPLFKQRINNTHILVSERHHFMPISLNQSEDNALVRKINCFDLIKNNNNNNKNSMLDCVEANHSIYVSFDFVSRKFDVT